MISSECDQLVCSVSGPTKFPRGPGAVCLEKRSSNVAGQGTCAHINCFYGSGLRGPDKVPDGARCGRTSGDDGDSNAHMCLRGTCRSAQQVRSEVVGGDAVCQHGGTVNSLGHCHCPAGYAPPNCREVGDGGSVDSGPPGSGSAGGLSPGGAAAAAVVSLLCLTAAAVAAVFAVRGGAAGSAKGRCSWCFLLLSRRRRRVRRQQKPVASLKTPPRKWPPAVGAGGAAAVSISGPMPMPQPDRPRLGNPVDAGAVVSVAG